MIDWLIDAQEQNNVLRWLSKVDQFNPICELHETIYTMTINQFKPYKLGTFAICIEIPLRMFCCYALHKCTKACMHRKTAVEINEVRSIYMISCWLFNCNVTVMADMR